MFVFEAAIVSVAKNASVKKRLVFFDSFSNKSILCLPAVKFLLEYFLKGIFKQTNKGSKLTPRAWSLSLHTCNGHCEQMQSSSEANFPSSFSASKAAASSRWFCPHNCCHFPSGCSKPPRGNYLLLAAQGSQEPSAASPVSPPQCVCVGGVGGEPGNRRVMTLLLQLPH